MLTMIHAREPRRRRMPRRRSGMPVSLVIPLLLAAMAIGYGLGPGVRASFVSTSTKATGLLTFAKLAGTFATATDDTGSTSGSTGGSTESMTVTSLVMATSTHRYTTLTNSGTVASSFIGQVTGSGVTGTLTVAVDTCSVAWVAAVCTGTTTSVLAATALSGAPTVTYASAGSPLAPNGVLNLRYTFTATSTTASATATAAAAATATGAGTDRTAG